ncbi:MAG: winged helix-turn-helix domain-containing protein [Paludisphaera borealis]|nr:winged helix-turn-helix domain-containing protein [Paludisphaera borealis]MDR3618759.1 winged helix-turn-helix domain-containing protein [Paludisphaera borealis]
MTSERLQELERLLLRGAKSYGSHNDLWCARRVAEVVRRFGVEYHTEHVHKLIRRRLGWSGQRPQKQAKQRNHEKVARGQGAEGPPGLPRRVGLPAHAGRPPHVCAEGRDADH